MRIYRYSAVNMFGIPLDNPEKITQEDGLVKILDSYGIEPEPVPSDPTNITPYYWKNNNLVYFTSRADPDGPVVIDLLPKHADVEAYLMGRVGPAVVVASGIRRIEIPTDQDSMAIIGAGSPRFAGQLCLHEFITARDI